MAGARLRALVGKGRAEARPFAHARVLLNADQGKACPGWTDAAIAAVLNVGPATVAPVCRKGSPPGWAQPWRAKPFIGCTLPNWTAPRKPTASPSPAARSPLPRP